ncbi:efflux RND transporter periplasmic adaptor subunit [Pseudomonas putida]|nr:efflux RND transporter periplasmic adaptor subunit [Pseudomonas putida]
MSVRPGQRVDGATSLLNITQVDALWLDVQIPAAASIGIQPGAGVTVVDKGINGRVINLSPTLSATSQFVVLRAEIENANGALRPGELVTVEIPVQAAGKSWDIPLSAVARNKTDSVVFVRTPDGFEARPVKVEVSAGQLVRVQGNISEQDQVAVAGVIALKGAWLEEDGE